MSPDAIAAIGLHDEVQPAAFQPAPAVGGSELPFGRLVTEGLRAVDQRLAASQSDLQALALGESRNLHEVMVRMEEGRIAFQLLLQARNRVLEAYQDVMRMQL
jgi:flagellar hook-basal body complex protein FliE